MHGIVGQMRIGYVALHGEAAAHLFAPRLGVFDYLHGAVHRGAFF
jgi:hypothetical protein